MLHELILKFIQAGIYLIFLFLSFLIEIHFALLRVKLREGGGGLIGNLASFCQNAPINMQKHFLGSVIVSASSKLGKTASQHGRH